MAFTGFLTILWMLYASLIDVGVPIITIYLMSVVIGISTMSFHGVSITCIGEQAKPGQILICGETCQGIGDRCEVRSLGPVLLEGRATPVTVHEVLCTL